MTLVFLGLGSNLGDREGYLRQGVEGIRRRGVHGVALSALYETDPVGYPHQPPFLNMALCAHTPLSPHEVLEVCRAVEGEAGRTRPFPNAPRTLDVDILLYGEVAMTSPSLTLPHPRLHERAFVLIPLCDLAPDVVHPCLGLPLGALARRVGGEGVRRWAPPPPWLA
jgi:2-amino-4-hydroxy-6-hydroxymethyldihydropteridine diphosphokinase